MIADLEQGQVVNKQLQDKHLSMSPQQRRYSGNSRALEAYKDFVVGEAGWGKFCLFEFYNLFFSGLPGLLGYASRRILLPQFLKSGGKSLTLGKGCIIRQPNSITCGANVIVEDYVTLDVRSTDKQSAIEIGDHVLIGRFSTIAAKGGTVKIGPASNISSSCRIASQSGIEIGESVLIAAYVYLGPGNHGIGGKDRPIIEQPMDLRGGVKIGNNAWIGTHSTIVDGVSIGEHAIVGAHSLVLEDVPAGAIVVGAPAKILRYRD